MGKVSSFFKKVFGGKKKAPADSIQDLQFFDNPLYEAKADDAGTDTEFDNDSFVEEFGTETEFDNDSFVEEAGTETEFDNDDFVEELDEADAVQIPDDPATAMETLARDLAVNEHKTHFHKSKGLFTGKNSADYDSVLAALNESIAATKGSFSNDVEANNKMFLRAAKASATLAAACNAYVHKKAGARSSAGKQRLDKITQILTLANRDKENLWKIYDSLHFMSAEQQASLSWDRILRDARREHLEVDDLSARKKLGAAMKVGDAASRALDTGVFSAEEVAKTGSSRLSNWNDVANGFKSASLGDRNAERKITERNVATSRLASLVGLDSIIAQSKTVEVHDKASDRTITGNLMEWAKGKEAEKTVTAKGLMITRAAGDDFEKRKEMAKAISSPKFMGDMMNLQLLDFLCGQGDRHLGNYFVDSKDGHLNGVTGIDNDNSFGFMSDWYGSMVSTRNGNKFNTMVIGKDDALMVPYVQRSTAESILALKPQELEYSLVDILEPDAMEAAKSRLRLLQNAIRKVMADEPERIVDEWSMDLHDKIMEKTISRRRILPQMKDGMSWDKSVTSYDGMNGQDIADAMSGATYYGRFMERLEGWSSDIEWGMSISSKQKANSEYARYGGDEGHDMVIPENPTMDDIRA